MAERDGENVARLTCSPLVSSNSPDSDVSPGTLVPSVRADYFLAESDLDSDRKPRTSPLFAPASADASTTTTLASISEEHQEDYSRQSSNDNSHPVIRSRKSSNASVTFRPPYNPSLPQGNPRKTDNRRLRDSSPSPTR